MQAGRADDKSDGDRVGADDQPGDGGRSSSYRRPGRADDRRRGRLSFNADRLQGNGNDLPTADALTTVDAADRVELTAKDDDLLRIRPTRGLFSHFATADGIFSAAPKNRRCRIEADAITARRSKHLST